MAFVCQQSRVGHEQQALVEPEKDVYLLRGYAYVVVCLLQCQPVVGELQLAAQHVVVGYYALGLQAAYVLQPTLRLSNLSVKHHVLLIHAEEFKVAAEHGKPYVALVGSSLQPRKFLLKVGLAYGVFYPAALIYGLTYVYRIVLLPVGRVGPGGVAQSVLPHYRLAQISGTQPHADRRQPRHAGRLGALGSHLLLQAVGSHLKMTARHL